MNYYVEMIKDFVMSEIKKENGHLMDDGEYVYACGLLFQKLTSKERKDIVAAKKRIISGITTFLLLKVEMKSLMREYTKEIGRFSEEDSRLVRMVQEYQPKGESYDQVMQDVIEEALRQVVVVNKYERQERYQKKVGLVSKTYKLNGHVVEEFAQACKDRGVALGPTLTELMIRFIEEDNAQCTDGREE